MLIRVVDDAPELAESMARLLGEYGHVALPTSTGFAGLLDIGAWVGVEAALVDLALNDAISGRVLIDWLAANAPAVRVVVLTGTLYDETARLGAVTLLKPARIAAVLAALEGP